MKTVSCPLKLTEKKIVHITDSKLVCVKLTLRLFPCEQFYVFKIPQVRKPLLFNFRGVTFLSTRFKRSVAFNV